MNRETDAQTDGHGDSYILSPLKKNREKFAALRGGIKWQLKHRQNIRDQGRQLTPDMMYLVEFSYLWEHAGHWITVFTVQQTSRPVEWWTNAF